MSSFELPDDAPAATLPRIEEGPLAFMFEPVPGAFNEAKAVERLRQCVVAGMDLDAYWYSFDRNYEVGQDGKLKSSPETGRTAAQLVVAVWADVRWLAALKAAGADIQKPDARGMSTLALATIAENLEAIDAMLALGEDIDTRTQAGLAPEKIHPQLTTLMFASLLNDTDLVKALVARGARLDAVNERGDTPLLHAIREQQNRAALALIEAGADIHVLASMGSNALYLAAKGDLADVAVALIKHGVEPVARMVDAIQEPILAFCDDRGHHAVAAAVRAHFASKVALDALAEALAERPTGP